MDQQKATLSTPVVVALGLAVLFAAGVVSRAVLRRVVGGSKPAAQQTVERNPYEFMREGSQTGGQVFRRQLARIPERALKRMTPGSSIMFDEEMVLEDLGTAMRGRAGYRGQVREPDDFDGVRVEGEQRQYFHAGGTVIVDAACVPAMSDCTRRDGLLDETETAVLANLGKPGLDGLVPERGRCEVPAGSTAAALSSCEFSDGLVLTIQRLSVSETRQGFSHLDAGRAGQRQGR
jgi:hypothetical protein